MLANLHTHNGHHLMGRRTLSGTASSADSEAAASRASSTPAAVDEATARTGVTLELTAAEEKLLEALSEVVEAGGMDVTLRVAGGWVRDKLLAPRAASGSAKLPGPSAPSGEVDMDVDVVLDRMTGAEFAHATRRHFAKQKGVLYGMSVVKCNPAQSKHLESATMRLLGSKVDVVHMRDEDYTDDSRIPGVSVGTPITDTRRRDFTVNALFYNVATKEVEDWTGRGLTDLSNRMLSTPAPPLQTFLDDPLRLLRAVRFATTLGFSLDPKIVTAVQGEEGRAVRSALLRKVSCERIGTEARKAFAAADFSRAAALIHLLGLRDALLLPRGPGGNSTQDGSLTDRYRNVVQLEWTDGQWAAGLSTVRTLHETLHAIGVPPASDALPDGLAEGSEGVLPVAALLLPMALRFAGPPVDPYTVPEARDFRSAADVSDEPWCGVTPQRAGSLAGLWKRSFKEGLREVRKVADAIAVSSFRWKRSSGVDLALLMTGALSMPTVLPPAARKPGDAPLTPAEQASLVEWGLWINAVGEKWSAAACLAVCGRTSGAQGDSDVTIDEEWITASQSVVLDVREVANPSRERRLVVAQAREALQSIEAARLPELLRLPKQITGRDVMARMSLHSGVRVGNVLDAVYVRDALRLNATSDASEEAERTWAWLGAL